MPLGRRLGPDEDEEIQRKPPPGKKHWNVPRRDGHVRLRIEDEDEAGAAGNLQSGAATCGANLSGWRALLAVAPRSGRAGR